MYIEPPCKSGGGRKYDSIKCDQDFIGILRLVKELVFNFDGNKELTHAMWDPMRRCSNAGNIYSI